MVAPKLRFSFSEALPPRKLAEITMWSSGGTPSKSKTEYWNGDISWFSASTMKSHHLTNSETKITTLGLSNGSKLANKNDILLLVRGSMLFNKIPVGILNTNAAFNQDVKAIKCKGEISPKYMLQWFLAKEPILLGMVTGTGIGAGKLDTAELQDMDVHIPCDEEQTKIADFLSSVDEKITLQTKQYELLCRYKKGMMQRIFSQELRFKDENGEEFAEWASKFISEISEVNPKSTAIPDEFIYIDLESVQSGQLLKENKIAKIDAPSRAQRVLTVNDVLFQLVRPYQQNNLLFKYNGEYVASTGYAQLRAKESAAFLYQLLHLDDFTAEVMNRCTGTSYPAINSSDLADIEAYIPCIQEQTKIADFLTAIDDKITAAKKQLEQLKQWKKGLLQQMFI